MRARGFRASVRGSALAGVGRVCLTGLLHATAGGAAVLGGLLLAVPGVVEIDGAGEALAQAAGFGLASLRVPLESGDVQGTFAPLSGLLLTLWGLVPAARAIEWPWGRPARTAAVAGGFSLTCAVAAAVSGAAAAVDPSVFGAAVAGLACGAIAGAWPPGPSRASRARASRLAERLRAISLGPPAVRPGILAAVVALGLSATWFLAAVAAGLAGRPLRELAGGLILAVAVAPNAAVVLLAGAVGAVAEATLSGTGFDPVRGPLLRWDWAQLDFAPAYSFLLLAAPLAGVVAGGRAAGAGAPGASVPRRSLRLAVVFAAALLFVGWAGSLEATAGGAREEVSIDVGFEPLRTAALALVWGFAGGVAGPLLRRPSRRGPHSSVTRP